MSEHAQQASDLGSAPRRAGFWLRGLALALDLASVCLAAAMVAVTAMNYRHLSDPAYLYGDGAAYGFEMLAYLAAAVAVALLLFPLFSAVFLASRLQATPGKLTTRCYVVDAEGRRLGFARALGRELAKLASFASLLFGFLMAAFTPEKTALHDLLAGTRVRRQPPRDLPAARPADAADFVGPPPRREIGRLAYVFAGLGAVPVLGWPFGIAALVWGLASRRAEARRVAVVAAICTFGLAVFYGLAYVVSVKTVLENQERIVAGAVGVQVTRAALVRAACHVELFRARYGRFPSDLRELYGAHHELDLWLSIEDNLAWEDKTLEPPLFTYFPEAGGYELFSVGPDGEAGTRDDVRPPPRWDCPEFNPLLAPGRRDRRDREI